MSFIFGLGHVAYIGCAVIMAVVLVTGLPKLLTDDPKDKWTRKERFGGGLFMLFCAAYVAPFFWLLFYVPGYWKAFFVLIWDSIFG